jgi:SNF2 family DNA or RNA helicase
VWEKEFDAYSTVRHLVKILQGTMEQRKAMLRDLNKVEGSLLIAVINYEAMWRLEEVLTDWRPDMNIADESQRIKNPTAKQSKAMHELGRLAKYRLILTGTPVSNTPLDFWSQYKFLDPSIFEKSYYAFRNHYAAFGGYGGYELVAYKHLDELTRKAHSIAHRVTKAQALDLPERIDQYLYCDLEASAERVYKQLVRDKVAELSAAAKVTAPQVVTQMLRLSQLTGGYLRPDDSEQVLKVSSAKIGLLRETLEDLLDAGEKVVIFCRFLAEIGEIGGIATELVGSDGWCGIWGEIPGDRRGEAVRRFQEDSEVRIFIAQIQTAGAGITLHAASNAIFYSLDYSYNNYDQAKARIHRIGQHHPCTYMHLVVRGSIDEQVIGALAEKRSIADDVVDNWRTIFGKEKK